VPRLLAADWLENASLSFFTLLRTRTPSPPPKMTLPVLPRTLVVFDFDHSLMDEDSDQFVQALGSPELRKEAASLYTTMQW